jgi:voltage-gated potassium channel
MNSQDLTGRIVRVALALLMVFLLGTAGYVLLEGWTVIDALYMTTITLSTVGFREVQPLSNPGRVFTIVIILIGAGTVAYAFSTIGEYLLTTNVAVRIRRRRVMQSIQTLKDHIIVCGFGRVGRNAALALKDNHKEVVLVEVNEAEVKRARSIGFLVVDGDATDDDTLRSAGIERARGLLVCTGSEPDNLFIVLSARTLNPKMDIVVRSFNPESESKMKRAGANRVVSPYRIGGRHMANLILHPHVTEFLDGVTLEYGLEMGLEEVVLQPDSPLIGKTPVEADLRRETGVTLVGIHRNPGVMIAPDEETRFELGDELIVIGTLTQLEALEGFLGFKVGH